MVVLVGDARRPAARAGSLPIGFAAVRGNNEAVRDALHDEFVAVARFEFAPLRLRLLHIVYQISSSGVMRRQ